MCLRSMLWFINKLFRSFRRMLSILHSSRDLSGLMDICVEDKELLPERTSEASKALKFLTKSGCGLSFYTFLVCGNL